MKFFFCFVCVALSLLSAVNSIAAINTQQQATIPEDLFTTFSDLKEKIFSDLEYRTFLASLAVAFLPIVLENREIDDSFRDFMRQVKFVSIIREIRRHTTKYKKTPRIAITNAKKFTFSLFISIINEKFNPTGLVPGKIEIFQKCIKYFEWDQTIYLFTQSHTATILESCIETVIQKLENTQCYKIVKVLIDYEFNCFLELRSHYLDKYLIRPSFKVKAKFDYQPFVLKFHNVTEVIVFFMDYFTLLNQRQNEISFYISKIASLEHCPIRKYENIIDSDFPIQLEQAVIAISKRNYSYFKEILDSERRFVDKLRKIFDESSEWTHSLNEALSLVKLSAYPASTIEFIRPLIIKEFEKYFVFHSFDNCVAIIESLISLELNGRWDETKELDFTNPNDYLSLFADNFHCIAFAKSLPMKCFTKESSNTYVTTLFMSYRLFIFYKWNCQLGIELERIMKENASRKSFEQETCIICSGTSSNNDPIVHPLCSCRQLSIHAGCYARKMITDYFYCKTCQESLIVIDDFMYHWQYLDKSSFDILVDNISSIANSTSPLEELGNDAQAVELEESKVSSLEKYSKSIVSSQKRFFQRDVKKYSLKLAISYIKMESETIGETIKRHEKNIPGFIEEINLPYKNVLERMKEFLKRNASITDESRSVFERDWWNSIKELTEDDYKLLK